MNNFALKYNSKTDLGSLFVILLIVNSLLLLSLSLIQLTPTAMAISKFQHDEYGDFFNGTLDNVTITQLGEDVQINLRQKILITWTNQEPMILPPTRWEHELAFINGTDKVLLFGGRNTKDHTLGDTWIYDLSDNEWTEIFPEDSPSSRDRFGLAPIWGTNKILLFGGSHFKSEDNYKYLDDTWIFDYDKNNWEKIDPIDGPTTRVAVTMTFIPNDDKVLLYGGHIATTSGKIRGHDTWIYDLSDNVWIEFKQVINPGPLDEYSLSPNFLDDKILLYGGHNGINKLDETWLYDISDNKWIKKDPFNNPGKRYRHYTSTIFGSDKVILYGGSGGLNDTWIYDISANIWMKKNPIINAGNKATHRMASVYNTDKIILFGGVNTTLTNNTGYNETWLADTSQYYNEIGTYISNPIGLSSISTAKKLFWSEEKPVGTDLKIQIRSAKTEISLNFKDFVGPDGSPSSYFSNSDQNIWSGHLNDRWFQYKLFLSTSDNTKSPLLFNFTLTYNVWPATDPISPINVSVISNNKPTFNWKFNDSDSSSQVGFQVIVSDNSSFDKILFNSGEQSSNQEEWMFPTGISYKEIPDGEWYWKVRTKDDDGDWGLYSEPFKLIIDTKPPISEIKDPINYGFYQEINQITGIASDAQIGSGLNKVEITIQRLSDNYHWNGTNWASDQKWLLAKGTNEWSYNASSISWTSGEQYQIQSRAMDNVVNMEILDKSTEFSIDLDKPISSINKPPSNSFLNVLEMISGNVYDFNGSGIDFVDICIQNLDDNTYWDGSTWASTIKKVWLRTDGNSNSNWSYDSSDVEWMTDTNYTIFSRATDLLGNIEQLIYGNKFMFDNLDPIELSILINNGESSTNETSISLSLSAKDSGSGVHLMSFSEDGDSWSDWEIFSLMRSYHFSEKGGDRTIYFRVMDRAGNIAKLKSPTRIMLYIDTDGDGFTDDVDAFIDDPSASVDSDGDLYPDFWNTDMLEVNSTTGLSLDVFPSDPLEWEDTDLDSIGDNSDAFPTDPAASIDTDKDGHPDDWNFGMSEKDSTTGLKKDAYPNDPNKWKKEVTRSYIVEIVILSIVIIILILIAILRSVVLRTKRQRKHEPYVENKDIRKVRDLVISGKEQDLSEEDIDSDLQKLEERYESGEISEDIYHFIKEHLK